MTAQDDSQRWVIVMQNSIGYDRSLSKENGGLSSAEIMGSSGLGVHISVADSDDTVSETITCVNVSRKRRRKFYDLVVCDFMRSNDGKNHCSCHDRAGCVWKKSDSKRI